MKKFYQDFIKLQKLNKIFLYVKNFITHHFAKFKLQKNKYYRFYTFLFIDHFAVHCHLSKRNKIIFKTVITLGLTNLEFLMTKILD